MTAVSTTSSCTELRWYHQFGAVSCVLGITSLVFLGVHWAVEQYAEHTIAVSLPNFILKEAGMAGFIALFLNISIEAINRKRHALHQESLLIKLEEKHEATSKKLLSEVNAQLFKTVYERNIDENVFQQVEEHLLRAKYMRRGYRATFKLSKFVDPAQPLEEKFVKLELCNDYYVENLTIKALTIDVAKALIDVTPTYSEFCKFRRVTIDGRPPIEGESLKEFVKESVDGRNFSLLKVEHEIPAWDKVKVRIEYTKLAPIDYTEIIVTTVPMDALSVAVTDKDECFTVEAMSLHPENECMMTPLDERCHRAWEVPHAILPGQGIVILWHPLTKQPITQQP